MRRREVAFGKPARVRGRCPVSNRRTGTAALVLLSLLAAVATAEPPAKSHDQQSNTELNTITVEAQRETLERKVRAFVSAIAVAPYQESLARWQEPTLICPLVGGLPHDDGEFILRRLSSVALAAGAPLGPASCKPNFYVIVTSAPDALLKAWSQRDTTMFGEESGLKIHKFLNASIPIRVWYNATLYTSEGIPLDSIVTGLTTGTLSGFPTNNRAMNFRLSRDEVRDLTSIIVLIDSRRLKGVTFGQLAAYIAMIGLAEIHLDAHLGDAPSILQLFSSSGNTPPPGLSPWDQAFIKALYRTRHIDPVQLAAIKTSVVKDLAP